MKGASPGNTVYTDCRNGDILAIFAVSPFAHINLHTALKVDIGKGKIDYYNFQLGLV